jgi:hypothetical protein
MSSKSVQEKGRCHGRRISISISSGCKWCGEPTGGGRQGWHGHVSCIWERLLVLLVWRIAWPKWYAKSLVLGRKRAVGEIRCRASKEKAEGRRQTEADEIKYRDRRHSLVCMSSGGNQSFCFPVTDPSEFV